MRLKCIRPFCMCAEALVTSEADLILIPCKTHGLIPLPHSQHQAWAFLHRPVHWHIPRLQRFSISHQQVFFLFQAYPFLFTSPHHPCFSLHLFFFFPALPHFPLFVFSVTSILRWGRRNKNNNKIPYSFHFLDQR